MEIVFLVVCLIFFFTLHPLTRIRAADVDERYLKDQREALLAFKGRITGDPKRELRGWNNYSRPCRWPHITCDADEGNDDYVTGVELAGCDLSGELAPELGKLTKLRYIFLNDNDISGEIPPELAHMTSLEVLEMESNSIGGSLPELLEKLSNVIAIKLKNNKLNGSLPASLLHMKSLQYIDLSNNELSGNADHTFLPGLFFKNSSLIHVDLRGNKDLTGVCTVEVCKERNLQAELDSTLVYLGPYHVHISTTLDRYASPEQNAVETVPKTTETTRHNNITEVCLF